MDIDQDSSNWSRGIEDAIETANQQSQSKGPCEERAGQVQDILRYFEPPTEHQAEVSAT